MDRETNQTKQHQDPFIYASILNAFITDRNPIQILVGDFTHMFKVITNLGKNRHLAQMRIEQLQDQVSKVEGSIASVNPKKMGNRLDKLR
jgi:hypothetical protein